MIGFFMQVLLVMLVLPCSTLDEAPVFTWLILAPVGVHIVWCLSSLSLDPLHGVLQAETRQFSLQDSTHGPVASHSTGNEDLVSWKEIR